MFNFTSEIIFGQFLLTFGKFLLVTLTSSKEMPGQAMSFNGTFTRANPEYEAIRIIYANIYAALIVSSIS